VQEASRRTASGSLLEWKLLFIDEEIGDDLPNPFFIDWGMEDEVRMKQLLDAGTMPEENLSQRLEEVVFSVRDPQATAIRWAEMLGLSRTEDNRIKLGNAELVFTQGEGPERLSDVRISRDSVH
jgi:hypothetical protein